LGNKPVGAGAARERWPRVPVGEGYVAFVTARLANKRVSDTARVSGMHQHILKHAPGPEPMTLSNMRGPDAFYLRMC
jgi:hypothetical protein